VFVERTTSSRSARHRHLAWIWLASAPLFVIAGLTLGYVAQTFLEDETSQRSLAADLAVGVLMLAVWLAPLLLARRSARLALAEGDERASSPRRATEVLAVCVCLALVGAIVWNGLVNGSYT
jgi:hypothetical protein